jgi:hypothetical protein
MFAINQWLVIQIITTDGLLLKNIEIMMDGLPIKKPSTNFLATTTLGPLTCPHHALPSTPQKISTPRTGSTFPTCVSRIRRMLALTQIDSHHMYPSLCTFHRVCHRLAFARRHPDLSCTSPRSQPHATHEVAAHRPPN